MAVSNRESVEEFLARGGAVVVLPTEVVPEHKGLRRPKASTGYTCRTTADGTKANIVSRERRKISCRFKILF